MVYKGLLMNWKDEPLQAVAIKTLKGSNILTQLYSYLYYLAYVTGPRKTTLMEQTN